MINKPTATSVSLLAVLGLLGLAAALAGCGAGEAEGRPAAPPVSPPPPPVDDDDEPVRLPDELTRLPAGGLVRVIGVVMGRNDPSAPPRPFDDGAVIAMPRQQFEAFREAVRGPWRAKIATDDSYPLPDEILIEPGVEATWLEAGGTYHLSLAPGDYYFCLGNLGGMHNDVQGIWIERSFPITITDDEVQTVIPVLDRRTRALTLLE